MTTLHELFEIGGQSPWIDDLRRSYLTTDRLDELIALGIRGMTSNPTIMANAISSSDAYDEQFDQLIADGHSIDDAYWELVLADIRGALERLLPLFESSEGVDGFVSLEVSPHLARDTAGTIAAASQLAERIGMPNLMIKIPATVEGLAAIEEMISRGRSINVTLIFSLVRYQAVLEAYLRGVERLVDRGGDPSTVASVASFFISRVDTEIDRRLSEDSPLRGRAAIAQARLAYRHFDEVTRSDRFLALQDLGARPQRPLWASTSTKNPAYADLLYVEGLIAPATVNTLPVATMEALVDHGRIARAISPPYEEDLATLAALTHAGVDLDEVTQLLEAEGLIAFTHSYDDLLSRLDEKANAPRP